MNNLHKLPPRVKVAIMIAVALPALGFAIVVGAIAGVQEITALWLDAWRSIWTNEL